MEVTYLGCVLDETMLGETMPLKVINNINGTLKFLYRKNRFISPEVLRMRCNVLIQSDFDYACPVGYLPAKELISVINTIAFKFVSSAII